MSIIDSIKHNAVKMALFAAVTTGITAVINTVTKPTIEKQSVAQQKIVLDQVVPSQLYDNKMQQECHLVTDKALGNDKPHYLYVARRQNHLVAVAIETTAPDGYSGEIQLLVGADFNGNVYGVRVIEHHETPGLGDKIELRLSDWINRFNGKQVTGEDDQHFAVKKDGGNFDQFTGATITPRAVVNAVKRTTLYIKTLPQKISALPDCGGANE